MPNYGPLGNFNDYDSNAVLVTSNITVNDSNENYYDGQVLEFAGAFTVTISAGRKQGFGFICIPPAAGNASIASDGTALLNGATTTLTRAAAGNVFFAVIQRASAVNSYVVNGS